MALERHEGADLIIFYPPASEDFRAVLDAIISVLDSSVHILREIQVLNEDGFNNFPAEGNMYFRQLQADMLPERFRAFLEGIHRQSRFQFRHTLEAREATLFDVWNVLKHYDGVQAQVQISDRTGLAGYYAPGLFGDRPLHDVLAPFYHQSALWFCAVSRRYLALQTEVSLQILESAYPEHFRLSLFNNQAPVSCLPN